MKLFEVIDPLREMCGVTRGGIQLCCIVCLSGLTLLVKSLAGTQTHLPLFELVHRDVLLDRSDIEPQPKMCLNHCTGVY